MKWQTYCPECGFAASHLDETCPRCGSELPEETDAAAGDGKRAVGGAPKAAATPKGDALRSGDVRRWLQIALVAALVVLVAEVAGLYILWILGPVRSAGPVAQVDPGAVTDGLRKHGVAQHHATGPSIALPDASGIGELFQAQPSPQRRPTVEMYNRSNVPIRVEFEGPEEFRGNIQPQAKLKFQLGRGQYTVSMSAAGVEPRYGTAVFRQHTHYSSEWHIVSGVPGYSEPLRMGDLSD